MNETERGGAAPARPLSLMLARNSALNLVGLGLPLVIAVFAIPPILHGLGPERFGILGLVWVAFAYLALLDLGLGRATTKFAAAALAEDRRRQLRTVVVTAAGSQLALGLAGGLVAALAAGPFVDHVLHIAPALRREAWLSFLVLSAAGPLVTTSNSFRGALEAAQAFAWVNAVRVPVGVANFLIPLLGVWLGWGIPTMVAAMVAVRALALVAFAGGCVRRWPGLLGAGPFDRGMLRELVGFGGWVTVSSLAGSLLVYLDRVMLGALASVRAVGYYTVPHEMVTRLTVLPSSFVATLFPALAGLPAEGAARERRGALVTRSIALMLASVGALLVALALTSRDLLVLWLGADFAREAALPLAILALGMLGNAVSYVAYAAVHAAGRPDVSARIHLLELPVHVALLFLLVPRWGIVGAATAWSVRTTLDAGLLLFALGRLDVVRAGQWRRGGVARAALILLAFAATGAAAVRALPGALPAVAGVAALLLPCALAVWITLLEPAQRRRLAAAFARGTDAASR